MTELARPLDALVANDIEGALQWYERRRGSILNDPSHLYNLQSWARLLCCLGRRTEALPLLDRLADNEEHAVFVVGQRIIEGGRLDLPPEAQLASVPLGAAERHRKAIGAAMAEFDIFREPRAARHIAISGISFCGSTIMDIILEGLPGVSSIGESIWLTRGWQILFPYGERSVPGLQGCNRCGADCEYLTPNFRTALGLNPTDWYSRIAEHLNAMVLVSSDKNLPKIIQNDPLLRLTALALFKSPKQAWSSTYKKTSHTYRTPEAAFEGMAQFMTIWKSAYSEILHSFKPLGGKIFIDFDRFSQEPNAMFPLIAHALKLEYDPAALVSPSPGHSLGGNSNAIKRVHGAGHRVAIYPLPEPAIPADHAAWIDGQSDLGELHRALQAASERDLASVA